MKKALLTIALVLACASPVAADVAIEQHSRVEFGGSAGALLGALGGEAAREGFTSRVWIKGDVMLTRHGDSGQRVDLAAGTVSEIDYRRKRFTVMSIAEHRARLEQAREQMAQSPWATGQGEDGGDAEIEVDVEVDETGREETIGGVRCREVRVTVTAHPTGRTLEEGGGTVMSVALWLGPLRTEVDEWRSYQRRYAEAMGLDDLVAGGGEQLAGLLTRSPAMREAMEAFDEKQAAFEGTPMRTVMTFESVRGTAESAEGVSAAEDERGSLGGMLRGLGKSLRRGRDRDREASAGEGGGEMAFKSTSEIWNISGEVSDTQVAIPQGFRER